MTYLHVLTRCYKRPRMLMRNLQSMAAQTDPDYEQTLLVDTVGRGIGYAQAQLAGWPRYLRGEFVWILDDDDLCTCPTLVAELKAYGRQVDLFFVRMDHGKPLGVLPDDAHWGKPPALQHIGVSAVVVRRALWRVCADAWESAHYASDYDFIAALWDLSPRIIWHDRIAAACQRRSYGAPEGLCM